MDGQLGFSLNAKATDPKDTRPALTVTQLTTRIKGLLEGEVGEVWVRGEISGLKPSAAGHLYFTLKDAGASLSCAMFGANKKKFKFELADGLELLAHGRISVYAPRGNYQLIVEHLEPVGAGALALAFEQLKARLTKEGLFALDRKRPIPEYPTRIAIITSPTGAALQDMLNVLGRRNQGISILVVPTLVQGDAAAAQLTRAVEVVNQHGLADVIVLARGGGSMEDLWCFNDEALVRAVAASRIPTISAVGHEVDFTLCDFAADLRAPTPSAAAELVSRNRIELIEALASAERRLTLTMGGKVARVRARLLELQGRLVSPSDQLLRSRRELGELELRLSHAVEGRLATARQLVDELHSRLAHSAERYVLDRKSRLEAITARLEALSPLKVLGRGYSLVRDPAGAVLKSVKEAKPGREVTVRFGDGEARAKFVKQD